jgi:predicted nucleic-acid-binding Zn-ribbon protein
MEANFAQKLGFATVSRHIDALQLSFRLTNGRPMPKSMTAENYVQQYYECVLKLHNEGFFKWDPKKIVCIDCCTNSRRLEREKTISLKGAKPKKVFGCQSNLYQHVRGCRVSGR